MSNIPTMQKIVIIESRHRHFKQFEDQVRWLLWLSHLVTWNSKAPSVCINIMYTIHVHPTPLYKHKPFVVQRCAILFLCLKK